MADLSAFDIVAKYLEDWTNLDRLEARGTLRIALKEGGLEAKTVRGVELRAVVSQLLPKELNARGIAGEASICERLLEIIPPDELPKAEDSPESVFQRLAGLKSFP